MTLVPGNERHAEDRSGGGAQGPGPGRIRALGRERHAGSEGVRSAQERADIPRIGDAPEREHHVARARGKIGLSIDPDDARRVTERRDLPEQLWNDVLAGDEQLDRIDSRARRSLDEILALGGEQTGLDAVLTSSEKLPDEPELLVLTRLDQA